MNIKLQINSFIALVCTLSLLTSQLKLESVSTNQNLAPTSFAPSFADLERPFGGSFDTEKYFSPKLRKPRPLHSWVSKVGIGLFLGWGAMTGTPALPFITPAIAQDTESEETEDLQRLSKQQLVAGVKQDLIRVKRAKDEAEALKYEKEAIKKINELANRKELTTLNSLISFLDYSMLDYNKRVAISDALINASFQIIQAHQEEKTVIRLIYGDNTRLYYHEANVEVDGRLRRRLLEVPVREVVPILLKEMHRRLLLQINLEELEERRLERARKKEEGEIVDEYEDHLETRLMSQLFRLEAKLVRNKIIPFNPLQMSTLVNVVGELARIPQEHRSVQMRRLVYGLIQAIGDYPVDSQNLKTTLNWLNLLDETAKFNGYWGDKRKTTDTVYLTQLYIKEARQKLASRITEEELPLPTEKIDDPQPQEPVKAKEEGEEKEEREKIKSWRILTNILLVILSSIAFLLVVGGIRKKRKENRRLNETDIKENPDLKSLIPPPKEGNFTALSLARLFVAKRGNPVEIGDFYIPNPPPQFDSTGKNLIYQGMDKKTKQPIQILETERYLINLTPFAAPSHRAWDWKSKKMITLKEFQGFIIIGELGAGTMGAVHRAWDPAKQSTVAIKVMLPEGIYDREFVERFKREIEIMGSMKSHPNIVQIHKAGTSPALHFVMDEIDGVPLNEILQKGRRLPVPDVIEMGLQTAEGLKFVHQHQVVHRDLKPANLFLTRAGYIQIADFGLVAISDRTQLTQTGDILGTPIYMSPEQPSGRVDERADIYALGTILYEALTGQLPFNKGSVVSLLSYKGNPDTHDEYEKVRDLRPDLPLGMDDIVRKAMAFNVEDRYQTADELIRDLKALKADPAIRFGVKVRRSARKKAQIGLAIGVPIFLLAALGFSRWILNRSALTKKTVQETPDEADKRDHPLYLLPEKINQIRNIKDPAKKREPYQRALEELNKAKENFPDLEKNPLFHFYRGLIQGGLGNFPEMNEEFRLFKEKANKTHPNGFYGPLKKAKELEERMRLLDLISELKTPIKLPQIPPFEVAA